MKLSNPFTPITSAQLEDIVARLSAALRPQAIYLFGSHALGVPKADSDIDIMVLVDDEPPTVELYLRGCEVLRELRLPVELHFCNKARFDRFATVFGTFQHEILTKGVLIYAAEN